MELIFAAIVIPILIGMHLKDKQQERLRAAEGPREIVLDAVIERDDEGNITIIRIKLP